MSEVPSSVAALMNKAIDHGWSVRVYEKGDGHAVLLQRGTWTASGRWKQGAWQAGVMLRRGDVGTLLAGQFARVVEAEPDCLDALLDELAESNRTTRVERAEAKARKAAEKKAGR